MMRLIWLMCGIAFLAGPLPAAQEWVIVAKDGRGFVLEKSGQRFFAWGFNYDRDHTGRLIEDYWQDEWEKVARDFKEMKRMGANVVRVHLQFGKFMDAADRPNAASIAQFKKLVALTEELGIYLDVTGLGCYHKREVPDWYDKLDEAGRWNAQAAFWRAVAEAAGGSPAIFCFNLMNEPVVAGGKSKDWLGPAFAGKHYVQLITLDQANRQRPDIARAWIRQLTGAIREKDRRALVTVGLVDWSLDRPGLTSGFVPEKIAEELDFLCVHLYPKAGKVEEAFTTLKGFDVRKPVVIEETFPLACSMEEFAAFLKRARGEASGVIGFYWGKPVEELRKSKEIGDAMLLGWLELFMKQSQ